MSASAQLPRRCWVEIDLAALERNLKHIRATLPPHIRYVAVVKADAYGHGLPQVAARLMQAGADLFAVANIAEAMTIRELSGDWPVLLLSPVLPDEDRYLAEFDLAATVSSLDEVRRFDAIGRKAGQPVAVHLRSTPVWAGSACGTRRPGTPQGDQGLGRAAPGGSFHPFLQCG